LETATKLFAYMTDTFDWCA